MPIISKETTEEPSAKRLRTSSNVKNEIVLDRKEEEDDDDDELPTTHRSKKPLNELSRKCPYLDTINKNLLDFDFEKLCSVSLSKINVYACLVCGKYFQGRGINTHAYTHSVAVDHHVFLNLSTLKFYCLPDNYEIVDSSLDDITYVLQPTFTQEEIQALDKSSRMCRAYDGTTYLPGIVGLNNIKANDYCNVILQAFSHVSDLRDYFLREQNYVHLLKTTHATKARKQQQQELVQRFGELLRKLWNPRNFKAHVSPHEMLQAVVLCSEKRFSITEQGDPVNFLSWLLNSLHLGLGGNKRDNSSVIYKKFRGKMRINSRKELPVDITQVERDSLLSRDEYKERSEESNFLYLTLDLPSAPLFKDELRENIIPQVPLQTILAKFDGVQEYSTYKDAQLKRFTLLQLPKYLILYIKRFTKNTFFVEKNPTIVNFSIKDLDLSSLLPEIVGKNNSPAVYDLIANVIHEGEPEGGKGIYKIHVLHAGTGKWFEIQDLHVTEVLPQMIPLAESYIQIWKKNEKEC